MAARDDESTDAGELDAETLRRMDEVMRRFERGEVGDEFDLDELRGDVVAGIHKIGGKCPSPRLLEAKRPKELL